jgi:hypothetical protein
MLIFADLVSYGLGLGATLCLIIALTRIARRASHTRSTPR